MHIADIRMGNADRFPWRANNNSGHLYNVFLHGMTYEAMGMDSEMLKEIPAALQEMQDAELEEIRADFKAYAAKMYKLVSEKTDRNKLNLEEEEKEAFAKGLEGALGGD